MSRNAIAKILLAASISFTACGGGSKSSDSTTTPSAQNEQAPVSGEAVPSQTTAGTTGSEVPGVTSGAPSSGTTPSTSERQPVSGTTNDTSGMGTSGGTGTTGSSGTMGGSTSGTTGSGSTSGSMGSGSTSGSSGSMSGTGTTGSGTTSGSMGSGSTSGSSGSMSGTGTSGSGTTSGTASDTSGSTTVRSPGGTTGSSGSATGSTSGTGGTSGSTAGATGGAMTEPAIFAALSAANQHEIEVSQLAVSNAKNKDVKKFAKMMIDHHKQLQASGDKTAKKLSITPEANADVTAMQDESRTATEKLRGLSGAEFDKAFMDQMVQDHEKTLTLIDNQIMPAAASNAQITAMLKSARPKIESHLDQARKLQAKVGGSGSGSTVQ